MSDQQKASVAKLAIVELLEDAGLEQDSYAFEMHVPVSDLASHVRRRLLNNGTYLTNLPGVREIMREYDPTWSL